MIQLNRKTLREFFFEAAQATYAGSVAKGTIAELPGSKSYTYQKGNLLYIDVYIVNGVMSGGQTIIYARPDQDSEWEAVWLMHYSGWEATDNKAVIRHLKAALTAAYSQKRFYGGRGPEQYGSLDDEVGLLYKNRPDSPDSFDFREFGGYEEISDKSAVVFYHEYSGRALIDLD